ncbi:MAG: polysaccharide deacetylase family protein [Candidatus Omnitrophica bacterium]|nr:polysaccharide deacetylase family protein [Candidatus Omnitrophota bacterium]
MKSNAAWARRLGALVVIGGIIAFLAWAYTTPVLMYHSVNNATESSLLNVSPERFEAQMRLLQQRGIRVLSFDDLVGLMEQRKKRFKSVVLTFDDGYVDNYTVAFPILKKYRFPATIFIVTDWVGTTGYLTWDQIREMSAGGLITFGSHTRSHCVLPQAEMSRVVEELSFSKKMLEDQIGEPVKFFSYPCGEFWGNGRDLAREAGYRAACATNAGRDISFWDLFAIRRIRVPKRADDSLLTFAAQVSGYYTFFRDRKERKYKQEQLSTDERTDSRY